jgi:hypothetical protein
MIKIGILTYMKEYMNLGTNMQAYCTLKAIQKAYFDAQVELINYSGWKPSKRPYLSDVSFQSLKNDYFRIKKYDRFFQDEFTLSKDKLISSNFVKTIEFIKKQKYHAIYIGADTVLELQRTSKDNLTAYWLDNTIDSKKIFIAASSHNVVFDTLSENQKRLIQKTVDGFSLLGVRDDATFRLLSNFISREDKRLKIIPDPTFTYEIDYSYADQYVKLNKLLLIKPLVCLHLLRDSKWATDLANYFKKAGYIVASLRPAYYADIILTDLSPFEQLGIYKYFDLVITHRFHDSIFCFKNCTPVIVFAEHNADVTLYGESKVRTLFKSFNVEKTNYIANKDNITARYLFDIHQEAINNFNDNVEFIRSTLRGHKERYEAFVMESRKICME